MTVKLYKLVFTLILFSASGCSTFFSEDYTSSIPDRPSQSLPGSQFMQKIMKMADNQREQVILKEIRKGNIPLFSRHFKAVSYKQTLSNKKTVDVTFWVMPDYLAVGNNDDFARIPMNPITAQKIADQFGCILPTTKIVDKIYEKADIKLKPVFFKPGKKMVTTQLYAKHHRLIQQQLKSYSKDDLIAGHKKDIVISNRLIKKPKRVAIYGWHQLNGKAIQPLSTIHGDYYADYSHGVRLVSGTMSIDKVLIPVLEVLKDPVLSKTISYEGPIRSHRYPTPGKLHRQARGESSMETAKF